MVNIEDMKVKPAEMEPLAAIFEQQKGLMEKYHEIEERNTGQEIPLPPLDLNLMAHQLRLKDFAWRVTEELGEALDAFEHEEEVHFEEEIADALHFLVELTILADHKLPVDELKSLYKLNQVSYPGTNAFTGYNYASMAFRTALVIQHLGLTMNTLKNKPWKQTHMITDVDFFHANLDSTWGCFIQLCIVAKIDGNKLYELYSKKNQVNQFRQGSNY